jgi:hypothetical protein
VKIKTRWPTICNAILAYAVKQDEYSKQIGEDDRIDDNTPFKRN